MLQVDLKQKIGGLLNIIDDLPPTFFRPSSKLQLRGLKYLGSEGGSKHFWNEKDFPATIEM